ncbi:MAG: hypothetical protein HY707_14570 [Ignavibacteriae bacterium]|nr:hypothetical protein [Ignavibacteriota bacterium]
MPRKFETNLSVIGCIVGCLILPCLNSLYAQYQTLGPASCGLGQDNCHATENGWWKKDPHRYSRENLDNDKEKTEAIAGKAGVEAANIYKGTGTANCMTCHGTIVSGKEAEEVDDGVSCESCHGSGSGYKDRHSDVKTRRNREGYEIGTTLGMKELRSLPIRASTCVRCHYIVDQKLLDAGHPDGWSTPAKYISGIRIVAGTPQHWKRKPTDDGDLSKKPFDDALETKRPAPVPKLVGGTPQPEPDTVRPIVTKVVVPPSPPTPPSFDPLQTLAAPKPIQLEPFPTITDSTALDQLLLIIKKRLELLYKKVGQ